MKIGKKIRTQQQDSITLEEMRLSVPEQNIYKTGIFYFILTALGILSSVSCFCVSLSIPVSIPVVLFFTAIFTAVFTTLFLMKRKNIWFIVGAMAIITVVILFFRNTFYRGILLTIKCISNEFTSNGLAFILPSSLNREIRGVGTVEVTFFMVCLIYLMSLLLSWILIKRRNFFLAAFITIPFVLTPLIATITPPIFSIILLILYYCTLIFLSPSLSGSKMFRRGIRGYHISSTSSANPTSFLILPIFLVCALLVSIICPQSSFKRSAFLSSIRSEFINGFNSGEFSRYMNATFRGALGDLDLNSVGNISFNNLPVLGLTMNGDYYYNNSTHEIGENHTEYLKGYVGSVYSDDGWKDLSKEQSAEVSNILSSQKGQEIFSTIRENFKNVSEPNDYFNLSIKYLRGDPRRVYIPYGLQTFGNTNELTYIDDGYVISSNSDIGIANYSFTAFSIFDDYCKYNLNERISDYSSIYSSDFSDLKMFTTESGETYGGFGYFGVDEDGYIYYIETNGDYYGHIEKYDPSKDYHNIFGNSSDTYSGSENQSFDELLANFPGYLSSKQSEYLRELHDYESFVNENYTQLPEATKAQMQKFISDNSIRTDTMQNSIEDITQILKYSGNYEYTLSPGRTPDNKDFAEYFLFDNKKGYCRHFSTSATLLLRAAGVPARYAEGYRIDSTDFESKNYIELLDSDAHAWVEIYYSGTGWVPIEVTPAAAFNDPSSSAESSKDESSSTESSEESSKPDESESESSIETSNYTESSDTTASDSSVATEQNDSSGTNPIVFIIFIPVCLGAIFGILALNRYIRVSRRKKRFADSDNNKATLAIYGYIIKLLTYKTKLSENDCSPDNIRNFLDKNTPILCREQYTSFCDRIYPIAQKAKFSGKNITNDELKIMLDSTESIRGELMTSLNTAQKFTMIYLDIL